MQDLNISETDFVVLDNEGFFEEHYLSDDLSSEEYDEYLASDDKDTYLSDLAHANAMRVEFELHKRGL